MQELKLYDPNRHPAEWTGLVHPGQFAVFHSDVRTDIEKKPDGHVLGPGDESTCLVFDSLVDAEAYCEAKVEAIRNLRCDIYEHTGKSRPPILTYVNQSQISGVRKYVMWGYVCLMGAVVSFWIEWHWNGTLVVPLIIGLNLVFAGLRFIYWGAGGSEKRRSKREQASAAGK